MLSIDTCLLPDSLTNPNQLIDSADKALYLAKDERRNCVQFSDAGNNTDYVPEDSLLLS